MLAMARQQAESLAATLDEATIARAAAEDKLASATQQHASAMVRIVEWTRVMNYYGVVTHYNITPR